MVVVGGANLDVQGKPTATYLPRDSNPGTVTRMAGGVGRNIAENLARLGLEVELVAPLGRDPEGEALLAGLTAVGVQTSHCLRTEAPTPTYLCLLDESGALIGAVADMKALEELGPGRLEGLRPLLSEAAFIVADANLPRESLVWLASEYGRNSSLGRGEGGLEGKRPRLYLDTVSMTKARKVLGLVADFDCVKPNRAEAALLALLDRGGDGGRSGGGGPDAPAPEAIADALRLQGELPGELFMSLGKEGMYYLCREEDGGGTSGRVSLPPSSGDFPLRSSSGAGDAACAALLWAETRGFGPRERAEFALSAAALTASVLEPVAPAMSVRELERARDRIFPKGERP